MPLRTVRSLFLLATLITLMSAPPAAAVPHDGDPKILLHAGGVTVKNACVVGGQGTCNSAVTEGGIVSGSGPYYFVYVIGVPGSATSLAGVQLGIHYQQGAAGAISDQTGLDIFGWTLCATLEFQQSPPGVWPEPGTGNLVTWDAINRCQVGERAVAGFFYVAAYSADSLRVTPYSSTIPAKVATCESVEHNLEPKDLGLVVFSPGATTPGCNPCDEDCPDIYVPPPPPDPPVPPAGIFVHLAPTSTPHPCTPVPITEPEDVVTNGTVRSGGGPNYYAYLLTSEGPLEDVGGLQLGINYESGNPAGMSNGLGVDVFAWHLCATLEFRSPTPAWPTPGSGNLITWDPVNTCQVGPYAVAGYFYLTAFSEDRFAITPRPVDNAAKIVDCGSFEYPLSPDRLGYAVFSPDGKKLGCNPLLGDCEEPVAVTPTTWSRVKTLWSGGK